jgi:hypothetical protein
LLLAVLGGALVARRDLGSRALGWALAALPAFALTLALTALRNDGNPIGMLQEAEPTLRAFLALLAVSSLALALVGMLARRVLRVAEDAERERISALRLPRAVPAAAHVSQRNVLTPMEPMMRVPQPAVDVRYTLPMNGTPAPMMLAPVHAPSRGSFPIVASAPAYERALDEQEILLLTGRKRGLVRLACWTMAALLAAAAGGYLLVLKPERDRVAELARAKSLARMQAAQEREVRGGEPGDALSDRMGKYLQKLQEERGVATGSAPVVTPLRAQAEPPAVLPTASSIAVTRAPEASTPGHSRRSSSLGRGARSDHRRARDVENAPAQPVPKNATPSPAAPAAPAKPAARTQNERELDLDELVQKAVGGGKPGASDDPILGL